ncbi:MAG: hypothetical protein QMC74_15400 [Myxococcota bacterium]
MARKPLTPRGEPDFELEVEVDVLRPVLHAFLCDLHRYVPLHPFIESIQDLPSSEDLPDARLYRVVDRVPLGPLKLKTVYVAALEPVSDSEVHGHAWQAPGIRLRTIYSLIERRRSTRLVERCYVEARPLIRGFVVSQARKAHAETLEKMKDLIEHGEARLG